MSRYDLAGNPIPDAEPGAEAAHAYRPPTPPAGASSGTPNGSNSSPHPSPAPDQQPQPPPGYGQSAYTQAPIGYGQPNPTPPGGYGQTPAGYGQPPPPASYGQPPAATQSGLGQPPASAQSANSQPPSAFTQPAYGHAPREPRPYSGSTYSYAAPPDPAIAYSGNDSGLNLTLPPEVAALRWNWGAFFLPPLWCASHGVPTLGYVYDLIALLFLLSPFLYGPTYGLLMFFTTAFILFGIGIYLGARGNEIAWRNRAFDKGVEGFFQVQNGWLISGFAVALPLYTILFGVFTYQLALASRREQALIDRATAAPVMPLAAPANGYEPLRTFQPTSQAPTTIIYGRPPEGNRRDDYMHPGGRFPGDMNGRAPVVIIQRPMAPPSATGPDAPGANPAGVNTPNGPNGQNNQNPDQPVSLPAAGQPPQAPDQNAAPANNAGPGNNAAPGNVAPSFAPPQAPPAPVQNTAPEPAQTPMPGLPPGQ